PEDDEREAHPADRQDRKAEQRDGQRDGADRPRQHDAGVQHLEDEPGDPYQEEDRDEVRVDQGVQEGREQARRDGRDLRAGQVERERPLRILRPVAVQLAQQGRQVSAKSCAASSQSPRLSATIPARFRPPALARAESVSAARARSSSAAARPRSTSPCQTANRPAPPSASARSCGSLSVPAASAASSQRRPSLQWARASQKFPTAPPSRSATSALP